jgi:hypothetical protein
MGSTFEELEGVAVETKERETRELKIWVPEKLPGYTGNVVAVEEGKGVNYITAEWRDESDNKQYPPDIRKGENVLAYQLKDSPKWYWKSSGRAKQLRTTEQNIQGYAANPEVHEKLTSDDMYMQGVDTEKGQVNLFKTSQKNGEPFGWSGLVDAKAGTLTIADSTGCQIVINPNVPEIILTLPNLSFIKLTEKNATIFAPEDLTISSKRQIVINSPIVTIENKEGAGACVINSNNMSVNASSSFVVDSKCSQVGGDVVIPKHLTSGEIHAPNYNNASVGQTYTGAQSNTGAGSATTPSNAPNTQGGGGIGNTRNTTAWQDNKVAIDAICDALAIIQSVCDGHPGISAQISVARAAAISSKMERTKGE